MKTKLTSARRPARALRQRGVVLFIALIAMVVLSLAGVALIRSVDTAGSVAGNIAFREASTTAVNLAVEQAVNWMFVSPFNVEVNTPAFHYYAQLQPGEKPNGIPAVLSGTYTTMKGTYPFGAADVYPSTKIEVRSVIERVCAPGIALPMTFIQKVQYCDQLPPKVSVAKTSMKLKGPTLPPIPLYRVTVRVDVPGTNTTTYAQAMLR
jgi:type IV pilus assembly protein PilX